MRLKPTKTKHHHDIATAVLLSMLLLTAACGQEKVSTGFSAVEQQAKSRQIDSLNAAGKRARENSQFHQAIDLHLQALSLAEELNDTSSMITAYNNIGTNYRRVSVLDEASRYHYAALELVMKRADQTSSAALKDRATALNGIGNIYIALGNYGEADSTFRRSLDVERRQSNLLGQAINLANLGTVKERLGQTDSAWIYYRHSLAMNRQAHSTFGEALCYSHFGDLHLQAGEDSEALSEYNRSYEILSATSDHWHRLDVGLNIIRLLLKQGNLEKARQLLDRALKTSEDIGSLEHKSATHQLYAQYCRQQGDVQGELSHYVVSQQLKDSIVDVKKLYQIQNMRIQAEHQQQQSQLSQAQRQMEGERTAHRITLGILTVVVLLAVGVIGTLWYTLRERSKTQRILQQMQKSREDFFANLALGPEEMSDAETVIGEKDRQFIGSFVDAVYSLMSQGKTDVESVAERMATSRAQLNRKIQAITGQTTQGYMMQIRISKAKRLLRADLTAPIGDVAQKCGFDDVAYFSRIFKQQTDMTPSQYRKMT